MNAFEEGKRKREEAYEDKDKKNQIDDEGAAKPKAIGESSTRKRVTAKDERDYRNKPDVKMKKITDASDDIMGAVKKAVVDGQAVSKNTVSSIVRRSSRLKGGARLLQLSKRRSEEPVETAAGLRMKILPEGNRVLPNQPTPGY